ncbi:hypothetical protein ACFWIA_00115 [Streptomyces sp. NPDC127068]|uniref:hypothetical protein n=1 Tax=Streptomyces sp. NPDC127068 TaxID=3347127 RepID=UPI00364A3734
MTPRIGSAAPGGLTPAELLRADQPLPGGEPAGADPLADDDALDGARLLDTRMDPGTATGAVLFDLRESVAYPTASAGLLVVRGVREFRYAVADPDAVSGAVSVVSSTPVDGDEAFALRLGTAPYAAVLLGGESAEFHVLDVPTMQPADGEYSGGEGSVLGRPLPGWDTECTVLSVFHRKRSAGPA